MTRLPITASDAARFAVTVVLPTPPLNDVTNITRPTAFGLTEISADDWSYIEKTYGPHMELFRNGLIFAQARKADALDAADERAELRHGLEPVDVESGRKDAKTTPFDGKGV